jgi:ATP-dependent phosphofructokinase / diphosphate-dependent phosphofructokinase
MSQLKFPAGFLWGASTASRQVEEASPKYDGGKTVDVMNQRLGYLVRCGDPDATDSIVPMPIEAVVSTKKVVNVKEHDDTERLRPIYKGFQMKPLFIMAGMG